MHVVLAINWAKHYTESSNCPQEFQITYSPGGRGPGLGTTFRVYPLPNVSYVVVESYNATLSIHRLLENSDETFVIDNEASYNILKQQPKYAELNWIVSLVMSGITASLRFNDLCKMHLNSVPFARLHIFAIGQDPMFAAADAKHVKVTVQEITDQMWSSRNFLANVKPEHGKYLSPSCGYRGNLAMEEVDDKSATKNSDHFVNGFRMIINQILLLYHLKDIPMVVHL